MKNLDIKAIREQLLLTQQELADKLGVSIVTIQRAEKGQVVTSFKTRKKIIAFCKENNIDLGE